MRLKKVFACLLALAMTVSLAACGGSKVTAQGLLDGIPEIDQGRYQDIVMDIKVETTGGDMGGTGAIGLKCGIEAAGNVWHMYDGSMSVGASGFDMSFEMESWMDMTSGQNYSRMTIFGQDSGWTSSGSGDGLSIDTPELSDFMSGLPDIWKDAGTEPALADRGKKDDYVVTYKIPASAVNSVMDMMGEAESGGLDIGDLDVSMLFSVDNQSLKQVRVTGTGADGAIDMNIVFRAINGDKTLAIPDDIKAAAVSDPGFDLGLSGDDGFSSGVFEDWPEEDDVYWADSDGQDEMIDGMGLKLSRTVSAPDTVRVWHMSDYSELDFTHTGYDWHGSLDVRHYVTDEYGGADGYFSGQRDFCAEYYSDLEPYFSNATEIIYIRDGNEMDMCRLLGDGVTISAEIYLDGDEASEDALLARLGELLSMAGIQ